MRSQKNGLAKGGFFSNLRYDAKKNPMLLVMMIPSVAFFLVFNYLPMVGIYYAFTDYNVRKGLFGSRFVGLNNFKFLFSSGITSFSSSSAQRFGSLSPSCWRR